MSNEKYCKNLDIATVNRKSIKSRLVCAAGATVMLVLIALLSVISNSRLGQLLLLLTF